MAKNVFGGYDVRAIYKSELDEEAARKIGVAFGGFLQKKGVKTCFLGRDNRESSESLSKSFIEGLLSTGTNVVDIGQAPSSTLCFALMLNMDCGGASITASHNPVQYNGVKFYSKNVMPLFAQELAQVKAAYEADESPNGNSGARAENGLNRGVLRSASFLQRHIDFIASRNKLSRKLKVALDCGNSVCGLVAPALFQKMGCETVELYCDLDGKFPNHLPDPHNGKNYARLSQVVRETNSDIGVMFDGDGDRAGFCDEAGNIVEGDFSHILLLRDLLARKKGAIAVLDLRLSRAVFEDAVKRGGKAVMSKAGRMAIHEHMATLGADYGGEVTGHISFEENGGNDDAFYSAARMAEIISKQKMPFSKLVEGLPRYCSMPEIRLSCPNERKFGLVEEVKAGLSKKYEVNCMDGVRVDLPSGWGMLRVSNTEPQVTLRFEGNTPADLAEIYGVFGREMKAAGLPLPPLQKK